MDYAEEQRNELEVLQSIYFDEFESLEESPKTFRIKVKVEEQSGFESAFVYLKVVYPDNYPEVLPEMELDESEGLDSIDLSGLKDKIDEVAAESLGSPVVFNVVSAAKEWLDGTVADYIKRKEEKAEEVARLAEELEQKKFQGTRVTVATFLEWKKKFDKEMAEKESERQRALEEARKGRMTGRQLFETDKSLVTSDSKFIEEGDIAVDASLFVGVDTDVPESNPDDEEEERRFYDSD